MMFLCQNADFRFSYKKQWFFNGFEQPTSSGAKRHQSAQSARPRRDVPTGKAHFLNEILKMLTVGAYRKDI